MFVEATMVAIKEASTRAVRGLLAPPFLHYRRYRRPSGHVARLPPFLPRQTLARPSLSACLSSTVISLLLVIAEFAFRGPAVRVWWWSSGYLSPNALPGDRHGSRSLLFTRSSSRSIRHLLPRARGDSHHMGTSWSDMGECCSQQLWEWHLWMWKRRGLSTSLRLTR
jgi:hypothetical protein